MVRSQNGLVNAFLINPQTKEPFPELIGHDKTNYVIGENNQSFQIRMVTAKKHAVYGCTLQIDGQMICSSKSFKDVGHFFGFKKGNDEFDLFQFMIPVVMQDPAGLSSKLAKEQREKMGRIVIEIFGTKKVPVKKSWGDGKGRPCEYAPLKRFQDKKLFQAPLTIQRGGIFKNRRGFTLRNTEDNMVERMDPNNHLDTILIRYSDFYTLVIHDHISLYNKDHLKFVPVNFIRKNLFLLEKMIITIIHSFKRIEKSGVSERLIHDELRRYIKMRFEELGVGPLRDYLMSKRETFYFNPETEKFMLREPKFKVCLETLNDLRPGNLIDPKYYTVPSDRQAAPLMKKAGNRSSNFNGKELIVID